MTWERDAKIKLSLIKEGPKRIYLRCLYAIRFAYIKTLGWRQIEILEIKEQTLDFRSGRRSAPTGPIWHLPIVTPKFTGKWKK